MLSISEDREIRGRYSQAGGIQRLIPEAVARPRTEDELAVALDWARERGLAVTPRGAGSAMDGSSIGSGLVLDLTGMEAALSIDPERQRATVTTGLGMARVQAAAGEVGMRFGPDPSSSEWATVGGMIATNAAGPRSHRLGAVDRWVEQLTMVTCDGPLVLSRGAPADPAHPVVGRWNSTAAPVLRHNRETVLARWPRTRKNTAGYGLARFWESGELIDLAIGSEGTLGVFTRATLRLESVPAGFASLRVVLPSRDLLAAAVGILDDSQPVAIELLDQTFLRFVLGGLTDGDERAAWATAGAILLVDFEADDAASASERAAQAATDIGRIALEVRLASDEDDRQRLWSIRHRASPLLAALGDRHRSLQVIEDGCVPVDTMSEYLAAIESACDMHQMPVVMFGHAGDGHVHVNLLADLERDGWLESVREIERIATERLVLLGGSPSGEHGAGRLRAPLLEQVLGCEAIECFQAVKAAFDPEGIFNPGVIIADGSDPLGSLKVGNAAPPLASGVAAQLQRVEEERGYGEPRWSG